MDAEEPASLAEDVPRTIDVAVYGIINAGKSSLINALSGGDDRPSSPIGGTTSRVDAVEWRSARLPTGWKVRLVDTPGLDEVGEDGRDQLATEAAKAADLILFVLAEDLGETARRALVELRGFGKPIVVAINKVDLLEPDDQAAVGAAVKAALDGLIDPENVVEVAASPIERRKVVDDRGRSRVETSRGRPSIGPLEARLRSILDESAEALRDLNEVANLADRHRADREIDRGSRKARAEKVADESSRALALVMAANPVPLLDFLTGPGGLAVLVHRVSAVYDEPMTPEMARDLARQLIGAGRAKLWGAFAGTIAGGAFKLVPGLGHLAGSVTQALSAGYFAHVVGRALVNYLDNGRDWGDGGILAAVDRVAASTDRLSVTRGLAQQVRDRIRRR